MKDVFVLEGARTPQAVWSRGKRGDGNPGGLLKDVDVFDLGAAAIKGALAKAAVAPERVDAVVFGSAYSAHPNTCYGSRYMSLRAGIPDSVPCHGVNIGCGTGIAALGTAAGFIADGQASLVAAGGVESASNISKTVLFPSFNDLAAGAFIGKTVEDLALSYGITRAQADAWALLSHQRAGAAKKKGAFAGEIVPLAGAAVDDLPLENPTPEYFAAAKASYEGGIVTGANAHGLVDGAAAVLLAAEKNAGKAPLGRFVSWAVAGVAPNRMAYASVPAIRSVLAKAGWRLEDVDLFEVNETFAAQLLIVQKELSIPSEKLNVNGGAVGLGHPFGATGARLVLTLLKELKRRGGKKGVAAVCVGGGQGVAAAVETV